MAETMLTDTQNFIDIAQALRDKTGSSKQFFPSEMANEINNLNTNSGIISQTTATANDVLADKKFVLANGKLATGTIPSLPANTYIPKTEDQTIADNQYLSGVQTIKGDSNLIASNIKSGVSIFGITGTLSEGVNTSDATASASDILSGKTAYVNGSKITGTIASKSSSDLTASGATITVPAGYYASSASKSVSTATQATPSISLTTSSGLITASSTQSAGYVSSGTTSSTYQLTTKSATTYTPTTSNQTISSGYYLTGAQTIKGDSNLIASNIKLGVSIFGISGSAETRTQTTVYVYNPTVQTFYISSSTDYRSIGMKAGVYVGCVVEDYITLAFYNSITVASTSNLSLANTFRADDWYIRTYRVLSTSPTITMSTS